MEESITIRWDKPSDSEPMKISDQVEIVNRHTGAVIRTMPMDDLIQWCMELSQHIDSMVQDTAVPTFHN